MTKILAIETATTNCSVALFEDGSLIDSEEEGGAYSHAEKLGVFIDTLLKRSQTDYNDLDAIAISKGPGSYTGLRIGVSLAKGLCYGLNIPLIAIDTLKHMAWAGREEIGDSHALYCSMIDARRMEVYSSIYKFDLEEIKGISADVIEEKTYQNILEKGKVYFFGSGAMKCADVITHYNAVFLDRNFPSARHMGMLAMEAFEKKKFEDVAYFEPFYLKEFIALKSKKLV